MFLPLLPSVAYSCTMPISGEELRDARTSANWTQAKLAEKLGVSQRTIVSWESAGVPAKSERAVFRSIGRYIHNIRQEIAHQEWLGSEEGQRHLEKSLAQYEQTQQEYNDDWDGPIMYGRNQRQLVDAANTLSAYDTKTLLYELLRREWDPTGAILRDAFMTFTSEEETKDDD